MAGELFAPLLGIGLGFAVLGSFLIGIIDLLGKLYVTYDAVSRDDLSSEQVLIYLLLVWLLPIVWGIYLLMGRERTSELFSSVDL